MGVCVSCCVTPRSHEKSLAQHISLLDSNLRMMNERCQKIQGENDQLKHRVAMLTIKIENYGILFSGNNPGRMTPSSYEISKRMGSITV